MIIVRQAPILQANFQSYTLYEYAYNNIINIIIILHGFNFCG